MVIWSKLWDFLANGVDNSVDWAEIHSWVLYLQTLIINIWHQIITFVSDMMWIMHFVIKWKDVASKLKYLSNCTFIFNLLYWLFCPVYQKSEIKSYLLHFFHVLCVYFIWMLQTLTIRSFWHHPTSGKVFNTSRQIFRWPSDNVKSAKISLKVISFNCLLSFSPKTNKTTQRYIWECVCVHCVTE